MHFFILYGKPRITIVWYSVLQLGFFKTSVSDIFPLLIFKYYEILNHNRLIKYLYTHNLIILNTYFKIRYICICNFACRLVIKFFLSAYIFRFISFFYIFKNCILSMSFQKFSKQRITQVLKHRIIKTII